MPGDVAPPTGQSGAESDLQALRREIDRIDDALLDLIVARTAVVERVGKAKRAETGGESAPVFVRPGREMAILHRLLDRHSGAFPKPVIVRLWREIFAATLSVQGPLSVAVWMPARGSGYLEIARDQYGSYTPMLPMPQPGTVVHAVTEGEATLGVLPLPVLENSAARWWTMLASDLPGTPRVIARLPVCGPGSGRGDGAEALAIGRMPHEATGHDHTLLVVETGPDLSRAGLRGVVEAAGLSVRDLVDSYDQGPQDNRLHLMELAEFVAPDDRRVVLLGGDSQIVRAVVIGGYPVPFSADALT